MIFTFIHPTHLTLHSGRAIGFKLFLCDLGHLRSKSSLPNQLHLIKFTKPYYIIYTKLNVQKNFFQRKSTKLNLLSLTKYTQLNLSTQNYQMNLPSQILLHTKPNLTYQFYPNKLITWNLLNIISRTKSSTLKIPNQIHQPNLSDNSTE